jgi:hypothetical protein
VNDEHFGSVDIIVDIQKKRIGQNQTMTIKTVCNDISVGQTYKHKSNDTFEYKYPLKYGDFYLLIKKTTSTKDELLPVKVDKTDRKVKISDWALNIARVHNIDTTKKVHAETDPYVMAFGDKVGIKDFRSRKAVIKNADFLIRQDSVYYIVQGLKIKQETNKPILWIHAWDECTLTIKHGTIKSYNNSIFPIQVWEGKKLKIIIKENKVVNIIKQ